MPNFDPAGVQPSQVGPYFDLALGYYDPNTTLVKMFGYVIAPSGQSQETTDTTDNEHLVTIDSPNTSDRFTRFPKVSQGDWSIGERQHLYVNPQMFYQSDGFVDVSTPGHLRLIFTPTQETFTTNGTFNRIPAQTDGGTTFVGLSTGGDNIAQVTAGTPTALYNVASGKEIFDLLYSPFGLVALTVDGLWNIVGGGFSSVLVADPIGNPEIAVRSMAYLDDNIYYINQSTNGGVANVIKLYDRSTNTTVVGKAATASEVYFNCICNTGSGIFFSTTSKLPFRDFLYVWSGVPNDDPVRIGEIQGRVQYATETLGTVYILTRRFQDSFEANPSWTLYSLVGTTLSVIDDARGVIDPNFFPTCTSVDTYDANVSGTADFTPMLWDDGRFLYVAWPGLATKRIDLVQTGLSQIGPNVTNGVGPVHGRRFLTANTPQFVDLASYSSTVVVNRFDQAATTGSITTSFYDFDSPLEAKVYRSLEFQTAQALTGTQAVNLSYRLDQVSAFSNLTTLQVGPRNYLAYFPPNIKGAEIQMKVTLVADASLGTPDVSMITLQADLGRVVNTTVACRREQRQRSQANEALIFSQSSAQDLQANLMNIINIGARRCYAYIPDPTQPGGVAQIQMRLIDYQRQTPQGAAAGIRVIDGEQDMECDVQLQLVESFAGSF